MLSAGQREQFSTRGLLHLRGVVDPADCAAVVAAMSAEFSRLGHPDRLLDAWSTVTMIRRLATHPAVSTAVAEVLGQPAFPFQTLNFETGTQQRLHADTVHFDTIPSGAMVGAWVALEEISADAGPLQYVPGSHLAEAVDPPRGPTDAAYADYEARVGDTVASRAVDIEEVTASTGDVILWAAGLLHGGTLVRDPESTRRSQVTHYYGEGLTYVTPSRSNPTEDRWFVRDPLIDIRSGEFAAQTFAGAPLRLQRRWNRSDTIVAPGDTLGWPQRAWSAALGGIRRRRAARQLR